MVKNVVVVVVGWLRIGLMFPFIYYSVRVGQICSEFDKQQEKVEATRKKHHKITETPSLLKIIDQQAPTIALKL